MPPPFPTHCGAPRHTAAFEPFGSAVLGTAALSQGRSHHDLSRKALPKRVFIVFSSCFLVDSSPQGAKSMREITKNWRGEHTTRDGSARCISQPRHGLGARWPRLQQESGQGTCGQQPWARCNILESREAKGAVPGQKPEL